MKISYNWLRQYVAFDWTPDALAHHLTMCGLEVEGVEKFESVPGGLEGVVVGEVKTCVQHPGADRLRLTTVDVGGPELLQIVCGAPNVAAGQKVPVATVGTTLRTFAGEEIVIKKSKIRGEESAGMICAKDELGLGEDHAGILVLDPALRVGTPAREVFGIESDFTLEIGLTANRVDASSHFGVARDVAALLRRQIQFPPVAPMPQGGVNPVAIELPGLDKCPRYTGVYITGVTVAESPAWLQNRLKAIGLRPISNVVDITNFVLHELGQPLHAFDADQIAGNRIVVKTLAADAKFFTLDGTERTIRSGQDLMICDGDKPVAVAGVMGGQNSEVGENTRNIFLESAYFTASGIRRTAKYLGLKTDASFRFERGTDPNLTLTAALRAAHLIAEIAGGKVVAVTDVQKQDFPPFHITFDLARANKLMGRDFTTAELSELLGALDITFTETTPGILDMKVPQYRVDVRRPQDVMEEILRIFGYNNVPRTTQIHFQFSPDRRVDPMALRQAYLDHAAAVGYREMVVNPLIGAKYRNDTTINILNNLSEELAVMRDNMLVTGLDIIEHNHNRKNFDLRLIEYGKTYQHKDGAYSETENIAWYVTGQKFPAHWEVKSQGATFFTLSTELDRLQSWFGFRGEVSEITPDDTFDYGLELRQGEKVVARWGRVQQAHLSGRDIRGEVFFGVADWSQLVRIYTRNKTTFRELPKFPGTERDISMLVPDGLSFARIAKGIQATNPRLIRNVGITDVYRGDKIAKGTKSYLVNLTLLDDKATLTDKAADAVMEKVFALLEKEMGAVIRK